MEISRVAPGDVDLDLAERMVALDVASAASAGLEVPVHSGPTRMTALQHGNNGRPVDTLWVAGPLERPVGWALVELPFLDNLDVASVRPMVAPGHRRAGLGSELLRLTLDVAREHDRTSVHTIAWAGTDTVGFLEARDFTTAGRHAYAVRRLDLHADPERIDRLYAEARAAAGDYELVRIAGPAPEAMVDELVGLHAAINDAPADEGMEPDTWDAARVREYDASMVRRRQTTYRLLARHVPTGEWAGMSLLCVDEFAPAVAAQEDTSVVRAHRGHRLGMLMKCDMVRWIRAERPEVVATTTWNATDNHHMIAVNERLGCRVLATNLGFVRRI